MQSPRLAVQELERCIDQLGLQGVQIGSHIGDWNLDAPELFPFFEAAADLGAAILVHPWDMMGTESMPKYWLPWLVGMPAEQSRAACCLVRSEEHTSELQSLMRISYAVFCLKKKTTR